VCVHKLHTEWCTILYICVISNLDLCVGVYLLMGHQTKTMVIILFPLIPWITGKTLPPPPHPHTTTTTYTHTHPTTQHKTTHTTHTHNSHTHILLLQCNVCSATFTTLAYLETHCSHSHPPEHGQPFKCAICPASKPSAFTTSRELKRHVYLIHGRVKTDKGDNDSGKLQKLVKSEISLNRCEYLSVSGSVFVWQYVCGLVLFAGLHHRFNRKSFYQAWFGAFPCLRTQDWSLSSFHIVFFNS
jgi:hypothetical protein